MTDAAPTGPRVHRTRQPWRVMITILAILAFGAFIAVTHFGHACAYTWSLVLFLLPDIALAGWMLERALNARKRKGPGLGLHGQAFVVTMMILIPAWCLLDVAFANVFFEFPNSEATMGVYLWGFDISDGAWKQNVPLEEFVFYGSGAFAIVGTYVWASLTWNASETADDADYDAEARRLTRLEIHWWSVVVAAAGVAVSVWIKHVHGDGGFPGYFVLLWACIVVPMALVYPAVRIVINARAFLLTVQALLLVALLWEVTLALPGGWWAFQHHQMMGIYIRPWAGLPVEEPILWVAACWLDVTLFELIKLWLHRRATGKRARGV